VHVLIISSQPHTVNSRRIDVAAPICTVFTVIVLAVAVAIAHSFVVNVTLSTMPRAAVRL